MEPSEYAGAGPEGQPGRGSNSGELEGQSQRGLSVKKSTTERDKNKIAQRAFRQRKKDKEKAKCASGCYTYHLDRSTMHMHASTAMNGQLRVLKSSHSGRGFTIPCCPILTLQLSNSLRRLTLGPAGGSV